MNTTKLYIIIACLQLIVFTIYVVKYFKNNKVIYEESIDIIPIVQYNGKTYWMQDGDLIRSSMINGKVNMQNSEKVKGWQYKDLKPVEIIEIMNELEKAQ